MHVYNSAVYVEGGEIVHVHRKLYLPNYGIWEERKHFTPGLDTAGVRHRLGRMAMLLCSDAWQPAIAYARRPGRRQGADRAREQHGQA